jgi:hypothetical protein
MALFLQIAVWSAVLAYLWQCCYYMHWRNRATWPSLTSQLGSASVFGDNASLGIAGLSAMNQDDPVNSVGFRALWRSFKDARVVLEMTDYAERNAVAGTVSIDTIMLASVRRNAMQRRISSLEAMVKCIFPA